MRPIVVALLAMAVAAPGAAIAQTPPPYQPGMGDLMVMIVQPRHLKLGLAGQARNWDYADYAGHELEESLEAVEKHIPRWRDLDIAQLMAATVKQPLEDIEKAVKARNAAAFDTAYRQLTEACNACHRSANLPAIVIKVPDASAFPNQEFRGGRP
jgi:predicted secreted protein